MLCICFIQPGLGCWSWRSCDETCNRSSRKRKRNTDPCLLRNEQQKTLHSNKIDDSGFFVLSSITKRTWCSRVTGQCYCLCFIVFNVHQFAKCLFLDACVRVCFVDVPNITKSTNWIRLTGIKEYISGILCVSILTTYINAFVLCLFFQAVCDDVGIQNLTQTWSFLKLCSCRWELTFTKNRLTYLPRKQNGCWSLQEKKS